MKIRIIRFFYTFLLVISLVVWGGENVLSYAQKDDGQCNIISIALDVSGSMKKTDAKRHSVEMIKLVADLCADTDYLCVTAYNDTIVYHSGLLSMGDSTQKEMLLNELDKLEFAGETDNGRGLLKATDVIVESKLSYDNAFVLLVTDGHTDLKNSKTDRTVEDSNSDMRACGEKAKEKPLTINVIGYTDAYNKDIGLLSVVSASSGGSATLVDNPAQFIQVFLNVFFSEYVNGSSDFSVLENKDVINRYQKSVVVSENEKVYEVLFSTEKITDSEILIPNENIKVCSGSNYFVYEVTEPGEYEIRTVFSVENPSVAVAGTVVLDLNVNTDRPVENMMSGHVGNAPIGENFSKELYASDDKFVEDVSILFADPDKDIVEYQIKAIEGTAEFALSGSMLSVNIRKPGIYEFDITAIDSKQNQGTVKFLLDVQPIWSKYRTFIVLLIIVIIVLVTLMISIYIVKRILLESRKERRRIRGCLQARFINLRSKNEPIDILWELERYPAEGVTLEELFLSKKINENFKDIEKVCFYPGKSANEIVLVHCMEGGVFLGEQNVKANVPITISPGAILYFAFAENASEIEVRYLTN